MFERYTEEARRSIFFARYEASRLGETEIDTEHLLLGILKVSSRLAHSLFTFNLTEGAIRESLAKQRPAPATQFSVDLPLSSAAKRVLKYAAEEANRLGERHVDAASLLVGLARDPSCAAARILSEAGLTDAALREIADKEAKKAAEPKPAFIQDSEGFRDLTELAATGALTPLVGRDTELRRAARILSRRTRNSVAIIGDPGVGKTALVEGLAQWFSSGVSDLFAEYRILETPAASLFPVKPASREPKLVDQILRDLADRGHILLCMEGLFDLALARSDWGVIEAWHVLSPLVAAGRLQCIATGTPAGLEATRAKAPELAGCFEVVTLAAPQPAEAVTILEALKPNYEEFHGVPFAPGAIEMAVYASGRFLPHRFLPDRALDLLDEAAAQVRVRREKESPEVVAVRKEIRQHARNVDDAIARHEFAQARSHSDMESAARQKLRAILQQHPNAVRSVTPEDIEQVAADRIGAPLSAVRAILAQKGPAGLDDILARLAERISVEQNPWLPLLAAFIARGSDDEIETLIEAIRTSRPR